MKRWGWILLVIGGLATIGAMAKGNNTFGPLFWMAVGLALLVKSKKRE